MAESRIRTWLSTEARPEPPRSSEHRAQAERRCGSRQWGKRDALQHLAERRPGKLRDRKCECAVHGCLERTPEYGQHEQAATEDRHRGNEARTVRVEDAEVRLDVALDGQRDRQDRKCNAGCSRETSCNAEQYGADHRDDVVELQRSTNQRVVLTGPCSREGGGHSEVADEQRKARNGRDDTDHAERPQIHGPAQQHERDRLEHGGQTP